MNAQYRNNLSLTSQFSFCGLPFRLDTYSGCAFNCTYCFARLRGGNVASKKLRTANPDDIVEKFSYALQYRSPTPGVITEMIQKRMPLHFGGMSDPFQPAEKTLRISYKVLQYLCAIQYPVIISTKSLLVAQEPYLSLLRSNSSILLQFSLSSTDDKISAITEPYSTRPSELFRAIERLASAGIKTALRWQPYIPGVSESPEIFVRQIASLGVRHLGFEHLKLAVEANHPLINKLLRNLDFDLLQFYKQRRSRMEGREFVLPAEEKLDTALAVKQALRRYQITFGAADNEFQYLSDTDCCCSGADQFQEFRNWNRYQIAYAIKKSAGNPVHFDLIAREWYPSGAVDEHINSNSRLQRNDGVHNTVNTYIRQRWEDLASPFNPTKYFGITYSGERDQNGQRIYIWKQEAKKLL